MSQCYFFPTLDLDKAWWCVAGSTYVPTYHTPQTLARLQGRDNHTPWSGVCVVYAFPK